MLDFHTHFFSRPFFEALAAQSPLPGNVDERLARVAAKAGLELPDPDVGKHLARWVGELDEHGVEHMVSFASLPEEVPAVAEAVRLSKGRLTGFALMNPKAEGAAEKARGLLFEKGFKGLLLFPAMHGFCPSGAEAEAVLRVANEAKACVVVHCGMLQVKLRDLLGLPRPYDFRFADPLRVAPAANRHRDVKFVIPHFGGGMLREALMVGAQCENVYCDTSSSNSWMATQPVKLRLEDVFERALGVFGEERILFGTDSCTFPRGWRKDVCDAQVGAMQGIGLDEGERAKVLGGNARRLLGLA